MKILQTAVVLFLSAVLESGVFPPSAVGAYAAEGSQSASATLDFANGLYARKMYGPAITEYEKFLKSNPDSPDAASARFRYADSFYFTKDYASAIAHFELFLEEFSGDKRADLAKFRLATARYNQGDRAPALRAFEALSTQAGDPLVKSGALFYMAKCVEEKGGEEKSLRLFERLIRENPRSEYATYAGIAIGDHHLEAERLNDALVGYQFAADNDQPPELARQARFKVAEIHFSQKNYGDATAYYEKIFSDPSSEADLRDKALVGLFYCDYHRADLDAAERRFSQNRPVLASSPSKAEIVFLLASLASDQKRYEPALAKLEDILADRRADEALKEKARYKKIAVLSEMGRKEESLKELEEYFGSGIISADKALFEKAQLLAEIGKSEEAVASFARVMSEYPASPYAWDALYGTAAAQLAGGAPERAQETFALYASRYPEDPNADLALLQIVQIDLDAKKFARAFQACRQFIREHAASPHLDVAYYKLGVASTGLGRFGHAAYAFRKIVDGHPASKLTVEALYGMAASLENARRLGEAIAIYEKMIRDYPEHALSKEQEPRMGYLYIRNNEPGKVITFYEQMLFDRTGVPIETDGVFWLIQYLLDQGLYDRLGRVLEALERRFPEKKLAHEVLFFKGESAMGLEDYASAAGFYDQAVAADPEGAYVPHAHLGRGIALAASGSDAEAQKSFGEALRYDHELKVAMRARFELANLLLKERKYEEAAKAFMLVAILYDDPKYTPPALYKAGECFRSLGRIEDAEKAFLELVTQYPESDWAKKTPVKETP